MCYEFKIIIMNSRFKLLASIIPTFCLFLLMSCSSETKNTDADTKPQENTATDATSQKSNSIYQVPLEWHSHKGDTLNLDTLEGRIPIMAMVFTNCGYACPRMVADLKNIKEKIPADKKDEVVFVLVSFDTERDTPERLKKYADEMQLDGNWLLLHGNEDEVRTLSMLLDVQYKRQPSGDFAHSNKIILLDKKGEIVAEVDGLGSDPSPILDKLQDLS